MDAPKTAEFAHIGKSVIIKGELSGSEDLFVDGTVEGTIELQGNNLVIGPNGQVRASVHAKGVVVQGKLDGNVHAVERVELRKTAAVVGDILTRRIAVEEGAYFKGKLDVQREAVKTAVSGSVRSESPAETKSASGSGTGMASSGAAAGAATGMSTSLPNPLATKL